jgi:GntR family transcriptional repressor for pyruvate dehydrogenase complex
MSHHAKFTAEPRRRLSDELAERIQAKVATGELRPGDRLPPILEMARNFRVAPTTVREALIRLESKRIVEIRHGAGVFINRVA